jgi:hypothetical protein
LQDEFFHSLNDWFNQLGAATQPAAHGRAVDWKTECLEDFFLSIERQMETEFVGNYFGQQPRSWLTFVDGLERLISSEEMLATPSASVLVDNMLHFFKDGLNEIDLVGDLEAEDRSFIAATGTGELAGISDTVGIIAVPNDGGRRRRATTTVILCLNNIEIAFLTFKFFSGLRMDYFAGASEKGRIYFCGFLAEGGAIAPAELFLKVSYSCKEISNEVMTIVDVVRQIKFVSEGSGRLSCHVFCSRFRNNYILQ